MNPITTNILIAVFSALVGGFIGHRLTLTVEHRKEYNELAEPLYLKVNRVLSAPSAHSFNIDHPTRMAIRRRMGLIQRLRFDAALADYDKTSGKTTQDAAGQVHYTDVDAVNASLRKLAKVLKRK